MKIKINKLHPNAQIPTYTHGPDEDAGMDLRSLEYVVLQRGIPTLVKTGLSVELPPGYELQIRSRSGLALKHGLIVLNSPATIDPGYRGEIGVILCWTGTRSDKMVQSEEGFGWEVMAGDRIAQMVVARYEPVEWEEAELSESVRGAGGFGSSGIK